ncbi:RdgB/HAM1 family non-canonical purine NTP pyrophosphatase [Haematobacter genomosp. 1]|uniref:dITP/XTP pyrophosphatase n=1 Tax=Haematobacter genomosp. 1 TaxID=366618 RepID=A0A212A9P8_9RHOB|nr:RdgB/HAM1 family non-canonical purine NTP pyrophosphatase [Haematobacter genomosp. 1]OWJ76841.1 non-canonical purine NTP pyrophosphatase, RdgB/HAM1 family [Haematobacter genomosp. 1]
MRKFTSDRLLVATHNSGKLEEIAELLRPYGVAVTGAAQMALPVPEETEETFVGNARIKAHAAAKATGLPALADDSGVQVDGLNGAPGVHTADWAETENGRDFPMAMRKVHDLLEERNAPQPWTARFVSTLVLAWPDGHDEAFEGVMPGQIVWPPRGDNGHGYDPIFQPTGRDTTFAEMETSEKNRISHRAEAFRKLVEGCFT